MDENSPEEILESAEMDFSGLTDREVLLLLAARVEKLRASVNGSVAVLNWIRENVQGLFTTIQQMNAAGGPAALIGAMMGNRNG